MIAMVEQLTYLISYLLLNLADVEMADGSNMASLKPLGGIGKKSKKKMKMAKHKRRGKGKGKLGGKRKIWHQVKNGDDTSFNIYKVLLKITIHGVH